MTNRFHGLYLLRIALYAAAIMVLLPAFAGAASPASDSGAKASDAIKPYCPFDEPRPKIPEEILTDPRLDVRVKVFVKSKNLKELFAELSAITGVKIAASREIWGDRPIIYFHDRPLRDVMTEISGLYGYYWLVKGKKGERSYELFEDVRHEQKRRDLESEQNERMYKLLISLLDSAVNGNLGGPALAKLRQTNPRACEELTTPPYSSLAKLLSQFGEPFLRSIYDTGLQNLSFTDFPPAAQSAMLEWQNQQTNWVLDEAQGRWLPKPDPLAYDMNDMQAAKVRVRRVGDLRTFPRFWFMMQTGREGRSIIHWPPWSLREGDLWALSGMEPPATVTGEVELPEKPTIGATEPRHLLQGDALILGDVLQAIAVQSDYDIIADYYFQDRTCGAIEDTPVGKLVNDLCRDFDYTCQPAVPTLRFRYNKWYMAGPQEEPPAELIDRLWVRIERSGSLSLDDILNVANLPNKQAQWDGLDFIPGANLSQLSPITFKLLTALGTAVRLAARADNGLPVSYLTPEQWRVFSDWAGVVCSDNSPQSIAAGILRITYLVEGGTSYETSLTLPDGAQRSVRTWMPEPLDEKKRKDLADQRREDIEADLIDLVRSD